jgi:aminoglycoside phosphotransferase (APT) family kinase protein
VDEADVAAWLRRGTRSRVRLERAAITIVRDAPGKRLTARCRLSLLAPDGSRERVTVYAKQYRRADLAQRLARQLRTLRFAPGDTAVRLPRLLGLDTRRGIVFLEALAGKSLAARLATAPTSTLEPAGALLAAFHRASASVEKRVTRAGELSRTRECADGIAAASPALGPALERVVAALARTGWGRGRPALLHGSFRPNHLLLQRGTLALLDLESLRVGPAAYDLANWIAALHYAEVEHRLTAATRMRATRALLRGYRANGGRESTARTLWLTAALLVQKQLWKLAGPARPHAGARPRGRQASARVLLARAGRLAARAERTDARAGVERLEQGLA